MRGITILDLTRVLAGPWATQHLADQGARVIKVEPPDGDETRGFGPIEQGVSLYYVAANRNKQSITLDLKTEAGREVLQRLLPLADVVVENFRPGVAERLGLAWDELHARFPKVVYVAIHGFGDRAAPEVIGRPGYDIVLQAMGGSASITGAADGPPYKSGTSIADLTTGLLCTQAILTGLLHAERTGEGQRIVVNMLQGQAAALVYHLTKFTVTGQIEHRRGNEHGGLVPYGMFPCADGWLAIGVGNDPMWQRLRGALELPDEEGWRTMAGRIADRAGVHGALEGALSRLSVVEADALLATAGVPAGPVNGIDAVAAHPAVELITFDHPVLGPVQAAGPVFQTATTRAAHTPPPDQGADRDAILIEAGLGDAIADLEQRHAFGVRARGSTTP